MAEVTRKEQREDQRKEMRLSLPEDDSNKFYVDPARIPDGMSYQWQRASIYGKDDRPEQVRSARFHWRPVPAKRHPELAGHAAGDEAIIIDGLILCERPAYLTDEAKKRDQAKAKSQIRSQFERLQLTPTGKDASFIDSSRNQAQINQSLVIPD